MAIREIAVFVENRPGEISMVTSVLAEAGINLLAINIAETSDYGILRLIADDCVKAQQVLSEGGYIVNLSDVYAVAVPDRPGGLCEVLKKLASKNVDIAYMYSVFSMRQDLAYMVFCPKEGTDLAAAIADCGYAVSDAEALGIK